MNKIIKMSCFFALILCFAVGLTSCSRHIPDSNGKNNLALESISLQEIISGDNCIKSGASRVRRGDVTDIKVKKFSGVETVHKFQLNGAALELTVAANVDSGNFKVLLCNDHEIVKEILVNHGAQTVQIPPMSDTLYLKVAGESASYSLSFQYDVTMSRSIYI